MKVGRRGGWVASLPAIVQPPPPTVRWVPCVSIQKGHVRAAQSLGRRVAGGRWPWWSRRRRRRRRRRHTERTQPAGKWGPLRTGQQLTTPGFLKVDFSEKLHLLVEPSRRGMVRPQERVLSRVDKTDQPEVSAYLLFPHRLWTVG